MVLDFKGLTGAARGFFAKDRKLKLIVLIGLLGMALIFLSQLIGTKEQATPDTAPPADGPGVSYTAAEYVEALEERLLGLIASIDGVGRAEIMVTLESGVEYVFAQEEKRNTDTTREEGDGEQVMGRVYQKENVEQRYILVDGEAGKKEALIKTELQPRIQGVVIVCEGADQIRVEHNLISVVTTALGVPSTRVCVVKIGQDTG